MGEHLLESFAALSTPGAGLLPVAHLGGVGVASHVWPGTADKSQGDGEGEGNLGNA